MKKLTTLLAIILICTAMLMACSNKKEIPFDETNAFFVAKIVEINDNLLLVEVTQHGNSSLTEGAQINVPTNFEGYPECSTNDYVRIEFDGFVAETYPLQIRTVFAIDKTDSTGNSIE